MRSAFLKKFHKIVFFSFVCFLLKNKYVFAADKEYKNKYAFEIERYFTILNKDSIFSAINIYDSENSNVLDFYRNKNKQHISINTAFINSDFKSIKASEYEKEGKFKYQNNHDYNLKNFNGSYSYVFSFGKKSNFLLVPYLNFAFKIFGLDNFIDDNSNKLKFDIFDINGGFYTVFNFLNFESSSLFIDILLALNFNHIKNITDDNSYTIEKAKISNFDVNSMIGLGYKTEFEISKLFGKASFLPKISILRIGKKMDSKNLIDKEDLKDFGGDVTANYNSIYAIPSFDLTINDMFKNIFLGNVVNTLSFKFKYLIDIASDYKNSYKNERDTTQIYVLYPKPFDGTDIALGFGLDKKYFKYLISYNFNREAMIFDFNFKF